MTNFYVLHSYNTCVQIDLVLKSNLYTKLCIVTIQILVMEKLIIKQKLMSQYKDFIQTRLQHKIDFEHKNYESVVNQFVQIFLYLNTLRIRRI
jgi:hypothetical protein